MAQLTSVISGRLNNEIERVGDFGLPLGVRLGGRFLRHLSRVVPKEAAFIRV
jgi:hypothetical protein